MTQTHSPAGTDEGSAAAPAGRRRWRRAVPYAVTAALTAAAVLAWLHPWTSAVSGIFPGAGDLLWNQAVVEVHGQAGIVGADPNLAWPDGFNPWSHPQLGLGTAIGSWLLVGILGLPSALGLWLVFVAAACANSVSSLFLLRSLTRRFAAVAVALSGAIGASAYVLAKVGHLSVAAFFVIPIALAVAIRWGRTGRSGRAWLLGGLVVAGTLSPLWWVTVALMIAAVMAVAEGLRRSWDNLRALVFVLASLGIAFVAQSMLYRLAAIPGASPTRYPWDSNVYGGHLADLLLASPFLRSAIPQLQQLTPGASLEFHSVGTAAGLLGWLALAVVVAGLPRRMGRRLDTSLLSDATIATVLFFLLGGLGNLQASVAVLLGTGSPARVWARLTIVLALLGACWLMALLQVRGRRLAGPPGSARRRASVGAVLALVGVVWLLDARATPKVFPQPKESFPEYPAVAFLQRSTPPCPVAQLPQDGMPIVRVLSGDPADVDNYYYRGLIPYLIDPAFSWSFGSWVPGRPGGLNDLTTALDEAAFESLQEQGFCAVLYDSQLAATAASRGIALEGRDLSGSRQPDFSSDRFAVYLLEP